MKRNRKYNIFGWLAASALLLTTACADNATYDLAQDNSNAPNTVTLTVKPQYQIAATRGEAENHLDTKNGTIGKGLMADVLIFTVYQVNNDGTYTPVKEFFKDNKVGDFEANKDEYQNAIAFNGQPVTLQFVVTDAMNAQYKVAFWAQNKDTKAYNTKDLRKVKVNYTDEKGNLMLNNDENRDAFCGVSETFDRNTRTMQEVILRRPLAQINVGTVGWDYEGAAALKPTATSYTQSTITLNGVAQFYDVVNGKVLVDNEKDMPTANVTFDFGTIPAFINVSDDSLQNHLTYKPFYCEEYLRVKLDQKEGYKKYVGWGQFEEYRQGITTTTGGQYGYTEENDTKAKYTNDEYPETEEFKYLSMSYVLVPEPKTPEAVAAAEDDPTATPGSVLPSVTFEFRGIEGTENEDGEIVFKGDNETVKFKTSYTVNNVPVQKNWRTNILGTSFFTTAAKFKIDVVPDYMGEYNYDGVTNGTWPGHYEENVTEKTYTLTLDGSKGDPNNFFTLSASSSYSNKYVKTPDGAPATYNRKTYGQGYKLNKAAGIDFTTTNKRSTVVIVKSIWKDNLKKDDLNNPEYVECTVKFDGKELPLESGVTSSSNPGVRVYTIENVPAGNHEIRRDDTGESGIFCVEVTTLPQWIVDGEHPDSDFENTYWDDDKKDYKDDVDKDKEEDAADESQE